MPKKGVFMMSLKGNATVEYSKNRKNLFNSNYI